FAIVVCVLCLVTSVLCAKFGGFDIGYGTGLYSGSQTISASIGVASGQIESLKLQAASAKTILDQIPVGYAVTYIYGTIGSAILLAQLGPKLLRIDLAAECAEYERQLGAVAGRDPGVFSAYRRFDVRAFRIDAGAEVIGKPIGTLFPGTRIFVQRVRRGGEILNAVEGLTLQAGDVAVFSGPHKLLVERLCSTLIEIEDQELLDVPVELIDVFVRNKAYSGKTIRELADEPWARGVHLRKIMRSLIEI